MSHTWTFFSAGGFNQVELESGSDLASLDQLDQKLWVALACPTRGLEFDNRTLDLIDSDKDGRVRVPEVIAATKWATQLLKQPDDLLKGSPSLPLAAINDAIPEGKQILASARQILQNLGKADAPNIDLEDTADTARIFAATNFNGDGIIPADAAADAATKAVIADIIACLGAETDRSGKPGISQLRTDTFFAEALAHANWWTQAEGDKNILPLGDATTQAAAAVKAVKAKVDDFFTRCQLAGFDPRALPALNRLETDYIPLGTKDLSLASKEIADFPLAQIAAGKALPLRDGVNPAWAAGIATLQAAAINPLLGERTTLSEADWQQLCAKLVPFETWSLSKVGAVVEKLGLPRVREILASDAKARIDALIARDKALEPEANAIAAVEKLIRLHRDLYTLCVNFVNFKNFYSRKVPAIFQAGRLYLDQRSCDLCLTVEDTAKHATMAGLAGAYLAYVDCVRPATGAKLSILAIVSQGDDDNLMIGRNGIFYDRKGNDYDATITKIIASPISLRQAFWSPYKKFVRFIEEQISKRAADAEAADKLASTATLMANSSASGGKKIDIGTVAALGVAFGSIGTFVGLIFGRVLDVIQLGPLAIVGAFLGVMAMISAPSIILAVIKLRKRNLGPILDANGWAVNADAKINVPLGTSLTAIATRPIGSLLDPRDPFAEKKSPWPKILVAVVVFYMVFKWFTGGLDGHLTIGLQHDTYFEHNTLFEWKQAPAPAPAAVSHVSVTLEATAPKSAGTNAPAK